jgi:hypothetical protein
MPCSGGEGDEFKLKREVGVGGVANCEVEGCEVMFLELLVRMMRRGRESAYLARSLLG